MSSVFLQVSGITKTDVRVRLRLATGTFSSQTDIVEVPMLLLILKKTLFEPEFADLNV